jgi:serine/threonine protein kinase
MTSRTITSVVTSDTIALNAAVFGYAGHSIVTPHGAIQQIWWTDERIQAKVTREFIVSKLRADERFMLDRPVAFGEDLTNNKYIDWILDKAKRLFLTLVETGVPDQIFGIIDDAWDDEDLPISRKDVEMLALSYKKDEQLNRKFYSTQYSFLLRQLTSGAHIQYGPNEVIPLQYIHRLPPAAALQGWLKMHLPKKSNEIFVRRKITIGTKDEIDPQQEQKVLADIETSRLVQHRHVAPIWASYTSKASCFILSTFEAEHTLKSFIDFRQAASLQKLTKQQRIEVFLTWLHCLSDALVHIHAQGLCHTTIMPSNILINGDNEIAFSDIGSLKTLQTDKKTEASEIYNYTAPEKYAAVKRAMIASMPTPETPSRPRFAHLRKMSTDSAWSSIGKSRGGSAHSSAPSIASFAESSPPGLIASKKNSISSDSSSESPRTPDGSPLQPSRAPPPLPKDTQNFSSLELGVFSSFSSPWQPPPSPTTPPPLSPTTLNASTMPAPSTQKSDIYSLGCVFLDILTYALKKKASDFTKHRSTKHKRSSSDPFHGSLNTLSSSPSPSSNTANSSSSPTASQPQPPPSSSSSSSRLDTSFHANHPKLETWMDILDAEAVSQHATNAPLSAVIPPLLRLVRAMLNKNPQLRPSALIVRERVLDALVSHARIESLCCTQHVPAERNRPLPLVPGRKPVPVQRVETQAMVTPGKELGSAAGYTAAMMKGMELFKGFSWSRPKKGAVVS